MEFNERLKKISARNLKVKHRPNTTWPIEKRIEVVSQYLVLGNMKLVSATTGVSYDLIREWKGKPWWVELEAEIRASQNIEMDTKLSKIVDKSLDAVLDRVENGDFIYDQKSGEIRRRPVALRDVHRVSVDMISKQDLIRKGVSDRGEDSKISVEEQLKMLAQNFAKWVTDAEKEKKTIDLVEVEDAIYEERQTGLQTGTGLGTQEEAGEGEGEGDEELGSLGSDGQGVGEEGRR